MASAAGLYSNDPCERVAAARPYRLFPPSVQIPSEHGQGWAELRPDRPIESGHPWPEDLIRKIDKRPEHAFGPANAPLLVLWHRPGLRRGTRADAAKPVIGPRSPNLGGVPHLHVLSAPGRYRQSVSWRMLDRWLKPELEKIDRRNPWALTMVACLNPEHGEEGDVDHEFNAAALRPGGRIDRIVSLCHPKVVLACGRTSVAPAVHGWRPPAGTEVLFADHPQHWQYSKIAPPDLLPIRQVLLS